MPPTEVHPRPILSSLVIVPRRKSAFRACFALLASEFPLQKCTRGQFCPPDDNQRVFLGPHHRLAVTGPGGYDTAAQRRAIEGPLALPAVAGMNRTRICLRPLRRNANEGDERGGGEGNKDEEGKGNGGGER